MSREEILLLLHRGYAATKMCAKWTLTSSHESKGNKSPMLYAPSTAVTLCQHQHALGFIKNQMGCTEVWVTSGGLFPNCTLAGGVR